MSTFFHKTAKSARKHRVVATLLGVVVMFGAATAVRAATASDFSLSAQPPSQTIGSGGSASYIIAVTPSNGFNAAVTLTAGSLPNGTSASWNVNGNTTSGSTATVPAGSGTRTATLTIGGGQPKASTYSPNVTGSSGSLSHSTTLTLIVLGQNAANFTMSASPSPQTVAQGTVTEAISVARTNWSGTVSFGSPSGLPANVTTSISPVSTTGSSATLTITTNSSTPAGTYAVSVPATAVLSGNSSTTRYAAFTLKVLPPFSIAGNLSSSMDLVLGNTQPLDLAITNPYSTALVVSNIQVSLASLQQAANAKGTCNQTGQNSPNFSITNLKNDYTITVPANSTAQLSTLGTGAKPSVTWLDQTGFAQNGCLGATLNFSYSANGQIQ